MAKFTINYEEAVKAGTVGVTLHNWLNIQFKDCLPKETVDRLILGWIAGDFNLIFDTEEL